MFSDRRISANLMRAAEMNKTDADFLAKLAAGMISERLNVTNREFSVTADLFSRFDSMKEHLVESAKITSLHRLRHATEDCSHLPNEPDSNLLFGNLETLPFEAGSINLITSVFGLHWCNDLPGMLAQIRRTLAPDGLFMCALPGDRSLKELRECLLEAETNLTGSASLRIDPFGEVRQMGGLLQRAGFALPVVDTELVTVRYSSLFGLIEDLRAMGATSALATKPPFGPRNLFQETENLYREKYMDDDGRIRATFEIVFLSGWAPHHSQQKPLRPGSATNHLKDFL